MGATNGEPPLGRRVLLVEDDEQQRRTVCGWLEKHSYEVVASADGSELLEPGVADAFPLILLDIVLPGLSGLELCRRIVARGYSGNVVLLSGMTLTTELKTEAIGAGAKTWIAKPATEEEVVGMVGWFFRPPLFKFDGRVLEVKQQRVRLTRLERKLFAVLWQRRGDLAEREALLAKLPPTTGDAQHNLDQHMSSIRNKIAEVDPEAAEYLGTIRSLGYTLML